METYREQLLKERGEIRKAEEPSRFLSLFKIRFFICLILFGVFSYLWTTGQSVGQISAEDILELVTEDQFSEELHAQMQNLALLVWTSRVGSCTIYEDEKEE